MRQRLSVGGYIFLILIAIGIIVSFQMFIIPICVFGIIFLLYKFPPNKWGSRSTTDVQKTKRKQAPFRVIQGNKNTNSEEPPKYH